MRTKPNGECIFLGFDKKNARYGCVIHEDKPLLCRAFPFFIEPGSSDGEYVLAPFPCRGLGKSEGVLINRGFVQDTLGSILLALIHEKTEFKNRKTRLYQGGRKA
jgi:Fe-S-cluster containining protein